MKIWAGWVMMKTETYLRNWMTRTKKAVMLQVLSICCSEFAIDSVNLRG